MKKFPKFYEYLDQKGKLVEKPKEEDVPDYHGATDASPPNPVTKGKKWDAEYAAPLKDSQKPYKAPGKDMTAQQSMGKDNEGGLLSQGDKRLVYNPSLKGGTSKNINGGKEVHGWDKKTKTEQFIDKTKNMSFQEFTAYIKKLNRLDEDVSDIPMVTAYAPGNFHPHPVEAIQYIVALAAKNDRILEQLIHVMKKEGVLDKLIKTVMEHPEAADALTGLLGDEQHGPRLSRSLARSMHKQHADFLDKQKGMYESVAPPFGDDDEDENSPEDGEGEAGELDDQPGEGEEDGGDEGQEGDENQEGQPDDQGGEEDQEGQPDDQGGEEDQEGQPDDQQQPPPQEKPRKLKKKFAHHNMLDALSNFEHMRDAMRAY